MPAITLPRRTTISKWATAGAWFFIAFSLVSVAWSMGQQWADPSGTTRLYGDAGHAAWGLTYSGAAGLLLAMTQLVVVGGAALLSAMPRTRWGRISQRVLMGWAGLWWLNLAWLASVDPGVGSFARATFMTALFGAVAYRAVRKPVRATASAPAARETAPDEPPVIGADDGTTRPGEVAGPPAPKASLRARALPAARKSREALKTLAKKARPAMQSTLASARRGLTGLQSRLQNGWKTKSV